MPFNVRFADHEEPHLHSQISSHQPQPSTVMQELYRGFSFGIGLLLVMAIAYAVHVYLSSFPNFPMFVNYWFAWR